MTKSLSTSDRAMKLAEQEKNRNLRDLGACRDVAHSLDRAKDTLQQQLGTLQMQHNSACRQLEKAQQNLEASQAMLQVQVSYY